MRKPVSFTFYVFAIIALLSALPAFAWEGRVVAVVDGDTITFEPTEGGKWFKVRLHGIDCPELRQPYGRTAKGFVSGVVLYMTVDVDVTPQGTDHYGRTVAIVTVKGVGILQEFLLDAGLAWVDPKYCKGRPTWYVLEWRAREDRRGLWRGKKPVPPWVWRRGKGNHIMEGL